ncbi:MAG: ATP-binding protein [Acidobacteriota bacterium]|nr:ATP-binding protein [Acidobacteriota bacterium]
MDSQSSTTTTSAAAAASRAAAAYENVFAFYGLLSRDGFLLELKGKIFAENASLIEPELLVGHKFSETVFWQSESYVAERLQVAVEEAAKGRTTVSELEFRITAQQILVVDLHLVPQLNESGEIRQIYFCAYDITPRIREIDFYKERSEHFLYAAENSDIGLWFWEFAKGEIFSTPKCNEFFGLAANEIITPNYFIDAVHPEDRERVARELQQSQNSDKIFDSEYRIICPDGNIQWVSARGKTYFDPENFPQSMMGIVRRITDRKLESEELKKIYDLERKARDEAEEANRAKDYFLAIVSHELRSPLNSILGWAKILLTKQVDEATRKNALETIERSAKSQAKLIEDLVDMGRVASGKLRLELRPVNLFDIVNNIYNQQKPLAESKKVQLEFVHNSTRAEVFGDVIRLQQVFTNLLNNALKFTPEGGSIRINMEVTSNKVEVNIIDSGQGIAPEFLPNIFRQFAQGDQKTSGDKSGLGLGLSIVKTLVEKHNGFVKAHSEGIGRGATFTVAFPLHVVASVAAANREKKETEAKRKADEPKLNNVNILLVEDDQDSRDVLALYLEQCGARIQGAESAAEAMSYLYRNHEFDIIISDLAMPVEDGYTFLNRVRALPEEKGGKIPALALSAFTTAENKEKAFASGFQGYHTKPFEPDLLIKEIAGLVKKK